MAIKFNKAQMTAGVSDGEFSVWVVEVFMSDNYPHMLNGIKKDSWIAMVRNGIDYCYRFGFEAREDQIMFLTMMFDIGPDFWWHDGLRDIMFDKQTPPRQRIDRIYDLSNDVVEAAAYGANPDYWFPALVDDHPLSSHQKAD